MELDKITPVILTYNEAPNIGRSLERLTWASRVVVVDSGSDDETVSICGEYPNTELIVRAFDDHSSQWNFGLDQVSTEWVLALDADYLVPENFPDEIEGLDLETSVSGLVADFRYLVFGKPLRGCLYPSKVVMFRRERCRYVLDGHTQLLVVEGKQQTLPSPIDHDDRKPLSRWFKSQYQYAILEAEKLEKEERPAGLPDRIRNRILPAAPMTLIYTLFVKLAILDGWPGWFYAFQRAYAELLLSLILLEKRLKSSLEKSSEDKC